MAMSGEQAHALVLEGIALLVALRERGPRSDDPRAIYRWMLVRKRAEDRTERRRQRCFALKGSGDDSRPCHWRPTRRIADEVFTRIELRRKRVA